MVSSPYQHIGASNGLSGLLLKYKMAKILFTVSLIAVVMMALASLLYPNKPWQTDEDDYGLERPETQQQQQQPQQQPQQPEQHHFGFAGVKTYDVCQLPETLHIPMSEDGTYTPQFPDPSLRKALGKVSVEDYDHYCRNVWDPEHGFTDDIPYNENGECGNWQEDYKALHARRLQQLESIRAGDVSDFDTDDKPRYISYVCQEVPINSNRGCGGMADRMSGMISTFMYALLTDRAYLAHWAGGNPIPLEILFEQPNVKWSYDPAEMTALFDHNNASGLSLQRVDTLNKNYGEMGKFMFPDGPETDFNELFTGAFVEVRSNRGYIVRTFKESDVYPAVLEKLGLNKINTFGCLVDFLFRPTIGSRRFINAYRNLFNLESVLSIGLQVRTNDNALANPQFDQTALEEWDHFLTCANQLVKVKRQPHHTQVVYFMVTDSVRLRNEFLSLNGNPDKAKRFFGEGYQTTTALATGLPVDHIEPAQVEKYINVTNHIDVTVQRMTPGVNSAIIENWLLGHADYRLISPQGYGKLAAFHARSDTTTISLPRANRKHKSPDCSSPNAFVTYDHLSTQWSLG